MKNFAIYQNPMGQRKAVKMGFSWPAFFFNIFWALFKKLWLVFAISIILLLVSGMILGVSFPAEDADAISTFFGLVVAIIYGAYGNRWHIKDLNRRGYEDVGQCTGSNPEGAIAAHVKLKEWEKENRATSKSG